SEKQNLPAGLPAGRTGKAGVVIASGYPKEEDILILGTRAFSNTFPTGVLKAALDGKDVGKAAEVLAVTVHSDKGNASLGAVFIKFEEKKLPATSDFVKLSAKKPGLFTQKYKGILAGLEDSLSKRISKLPKKKIYIKGEDVEAKSGQRKRLAASIGVILLTLLVISILFGVRQKDKTEEIARYEPTLTQAQHEFEEAVSLYSLDEKRARELISLSKIKVELLLAEGVEDQRLFDLKDSIDQNQGKILGEYTQTADLFIDLALLSDGFSASLMQTTGDRLFVLDREGEKIVRVSIDSKKSEVIAGPDQIDNPRGFAAYSDRAYVVEDDGVFEVGEEKTEVIKDDFPREILASAYAANVYVLDKEESIIWRYTAGESGFSSGRNWFAEGVEPNLSKTISWAIDGTIWLLDERGEIFKYSLGNRQNFSVSGVLPELISPKSIYTNEEIESLYILDSDEGRVVVLTKTGEFKAQYKSEQIKEAIDLSVSEKEGKIILLTGDKLYSLEIKHLED
ncbi:hypothetical protein IID22_04825, partial [Patescibacteria group bacterium]|nr:hypothetical protein [Patescibacteria group bacterium]